MQIVLALCSAFLTLGSFREIILEGMKADLHSPGAPPDRPALLLPPCRSVEYDVVHNPGVTRGTIDGGRKAWIVANALWIVMPPGEGVGQNHDY